MVTKISNKQIHSTIVLLHCYSKELVVYVLLHSNNHDHIWALYVFLFHFMACVFIYRILGSDRSMIVALSRQNSRIVGTIAWNYNVVYIFFCYRIFVWILSKNADCVFNAFNPNLFKCIIFCLNIVHIFVWVSIKLSNRLINSELIGQMCYCLLFPYSKFHLSWISFKFCLTCVERCGYIKSNDRTSYE